MVQNQDDDDDNDDDSMIGVNREFIEKRREMGSAKRSREKDGKTSKKWRGSIGDGE